jgi:hypothetical protein
MCSFRLKIQLYTASSILHVLRSKLLNHSHEPMFLVISFNHFYNVNIFSHKTDPQMQSWNILTILMCALIADRPTFHFYDIC